MNDTITYDIASLSSTPLVHHWRADVGAGRANEGLRAGWLDQLKECQQACGFERVRFHGLFHDDMGVYRLDKNREEVFNFLYIDELFDRMLACGVRPFVELGFCPGEMASRQGGVFWWKGHASPPWDPEAWERLINAFVRHVIARYGIDEVVTWYFEVWNEANLHGFWCGTRSAYFDLYARSARVIKAIDPRLKVGGPSTSNFVPDDRFEGEVEDRSKHDVWRTGDPNSLEWKPVWMESFLTFCASNDVPVDFVSTHPYPTDWAFDEHGTGSNFSRHRDATREDLTTLRQMIAASAYPEAEIHLTEWNSSASSRDHTHDTLAAATWIVHGNAQAIGLCDSLAYWTFTDVFEEAGTVPERFHGGFGMQSFDGLAKPAFHAYRFLNALGDQLVAQGSEHLITRSESGVQVLLWHYPADCASAPPRTGSRAAGRKLEEGDPRDCTITLDGLTPGATYRIDIIDRKHGHGARLWEDMGAQEALTLEQTAELRAASRTTELDGSNVSVDANGRLDLTLSLDPWAVALMHIDQKVQKCVVLNNEIKSGQKPNRR